LVGKTKWCTDQSVLQAHERFNVLLLNIFWNAVYLLQYLWWEQFLLWNSSCTMFYFQNVKTTQSTTKLTKLLLILLYFQLNWCVPSQYATLCYKFLASEHMLTIHYREGFCSTIPNNKNSTASNIDGRSATF
jgi:hypothetical protein